MTKVANEPRHKAKTYWAKSQRYARSAASSHQQGDYDPAVSSAVNAIINVVDAFCVHYAGRRSASPSHYDALRVLHDLDDAPADLRDALAKRLTALLSVKAIAQYEGVLVSESDSKDALEDMERALKVARPLAKKFGWE